MKIFSIVPRRVEGGGSTWHYTNDYKSWENYIKLLNEKINSLSWYLQYYHKNYYIWNYKLGNQEIYDEEELKKQGLITIEGEKENTIWIYHAYKLKYKEGFYNTHNTQSFIQYDDNTREKFESDTIIFQNYRPEGKAFSYEDNKKHRDYLIIPRSASAFYLVTGSSPTAVIFGYTKNAISTYGNTIPLRFEIRPKRYYIKKEIIDKQKIEPFPITQLNQPIPYRFIKSDDNNYAWSGTFPLYSIFTYEETSEDHITVDELVFNNYEYDAVEEQQLSHWVILRNTQWNDQYNSMKEKLANMKLNLI